MITQGVALTLDNQGRRLQRGEMRHPRLFRLAGGIERITQADQRVRAQLIGQQTGHSPPHRLATDGQRSCGLLSHQGMDFTPLGQQLSLWTGRPLACPGTSRRHVGELESANRYPARSKARSHLFHERAVHRCACTMRQDQAHPCAARRPVPPDEIPFVTLCVLTRVNTGRLPFPHPCPAFY